VNNIKTYVLDTNVLLSDPGSLLAFDEHTVIIPIAVLEELDNHKSRQDEVGQNARSVSRSLDELRLQGSLLDGIELRNGGLLRVISISPEKFVDLPLELRSIGPKVDNMIIALMLSLDKNPNTILVTKDINVRLKCDALGIACEDYLKMRVADNPENFYRGVEVIDTLTFDEVESFYENDELQLPEHVLEKSKLYPNQILILKNKNDFDGKTVKSAIAKCVTPGQPVVPIQKIEQAFNLKPRNKEQTFSLDLLFDENIKLLTLVGPSGTGKTLLAISAALAQLKGLGDTPRYDKLIVTRPVQPLGKDIGFLPGTMEEKMEPWIAPIRDNINFLMGSSKKSSRRSKLNHEENESKTHYLSLLQEKGLIEIEAITFIRGRSIPNAFIIIDEAQNLSMHELKTIVTRVGDNTKIVLTGDVEQIDNVHVDVYSNGLTVAVEKFKEYSLAGHVTLIKGERSELATLASKIL
jgi:PhoH-like ATPase